MPTQSKSGTFPHPFIALPGGCLRPSSCLPAWVRTRACSWLPWASCSPHTHLSSWCVDGHNDQYYATVCHAYALSEVSLQRPRAPRGVPPTPIQPHRLTRDSPQPPPPGSPTSSARDAANWHRGLQASALHWCPSPTWSVRGAWRPSVDHGWAFSPRMNAC